MLLRMELLVFMLLLKFGDVVIMNYEEWFFSVVK